MDSSKVMSDYELRRAQNILEIRKKLGYNYNPGAFDSQKNVDFKESPKPRTSVVRKKKEIDKAYKARVIDTPKERRQSLRIAKKDPIYIYKEFVDNDNIEDIRHHVQRAVSRKLLPVVSVVDGYRTKEITQSDIDNIAKASSDKKRLKGIGTTCHQCRQCSADTKTFCRNRKCTGINGQLCGPCLHSRYGEDVETTLKDLEWICPFCRGICNCSFCRRRSGLEPTGILSHIAIKRGYQSVHHYLTDRGFNNPQNTGEESDNDTLTISDNDDRDEDIVVKEIEIYQYFNEQPDVVKNFTKEDLDYAGMFKVQHNTEFSIPASKDKNEVIYKLHVNGETKLIALEDRTNVIQFKNQDVPQGVQQNLMASEKTENVDRVEDPEIAVPIVMPGEECFLGFDADLKPHTSSLS
ncbi:hypothetical protein FQR65_LT14829 [Abscondita terminalis]|nr:hypothetical protein FQR65_LT14829 [Abscondita terminalis]